MERIQTYDLKTVLKRVAIAGTLATGSAATGAFVYREVLYTPPIISFSSTTTFENGSITPMSSLAVTESSPTPQEPVSNDVMMVDIYACYPINNTLSPTMAPDITCAEQENPVHVWMKQQSQGLSNNEHEVIPETSMTRSERDLFDIASSCHEKVTGGATYSIYDSFEKNIDGCYRIMGLPPEVIYSLEAEIVNDGRISHSMLSSRFGSEQGSAMTIVDDAPPPWEWNSPK